ncbi:OmpW/AlkL family protein [Vreelandella subglaciescola]|jgi:outer membrane protein|uniref:Outer membrane protein n=1 Tax=Vreelandella subglaciescola TaxID=29571 RepID=A0A1M7ISR1_9GAMM|nr:OmpW family outer membrane protein [Halomonas subglaciescola]SHM43844.1 outer membrane protein [Halomonas subglaciescola]
MRKTALTALLAAGVAAAGVTASTQAFAYGAGDIYTRVGVAKVAPKSDNGDINTLGMTGLGVDVDDESGFAFTVGYRFHDKMGVELLAALPFEHDISIADGAVTGKTKHLPPTLTLQYYPLGGTAARVQPYIGAGINYTHFSGEEVNVPGASLELEDSWGAAGQIGIDLLIDDNWAMNAAAWYIDIDTDTKVAGANAGTVEIDPVVVMAGISYRF